VGFEYVGMWHW